MLINDSKKNGAVDKSEDRCTLADYIAAILGLIHGLIVYQHNPWPYAGSCYNAGERYGIMKTQGRNLLRYLVINRFERGT